MQRKRVFSIVVLSLVLGAFLYAASGRMVRGYLPFSEVVAPATEAMPQAQPKKSSGDRHLVDMVADDSYLIDKGDSTIFILVGNFAAHHNGAVILADSAVRYSNQSFECFGNVLINQNTTYVYGDRAEYNRDASRATVFSELVKVVDGDAVMYTYHCTFDTAAEVGKFHGGCYVDKGESHMESERGYYNTATHELIAVDRVEMRDETYQMTGDSVIFNTQTEDARYFSNTNIWNDKDEYLFANEGTYTKAEDLHHLTRDAYLLSPEREVWADSIKYYRTDNHIIGRGNLQVDDTTQKILGFADYGEWWDDPGNAFFTRRPSMINYDPSEPDSLFLSADTLWMYTISAAPKVEPQDSTAQSGAEEMVAELESATKPDTLHQEQPVPNVEERPTPEATADIKAEAKEQKRDAKRTEEKARDERKEEKNKDKDNKDSKSNNERKESKSNNERKQSAELDQRRSNREVENEKRPESKMERPESKMERPESKMERPDMPEARAEQRNIDTLPMAEPMLDSLVVDSLAVDSLQSDTVIIPTAKQLRYRAKLEKRRIKDSIRTAERIVRDSLDSIVKREQDSIQHIKDSILQIKIDSIVAKRIAKSSKLADEEKERMERIKQRAEQRRRHKIDKAMERAKRRGKEYTGETYTIDSLADSLAQSPIDTLPIRDSIDMQRDTLADSTAVDSLMADTLNREPVIPPDSVYKLIKAYRNVRMYRSDSQMRADSMTILNTDSVIRLFHSPILWNEGNQITCDSMHVYTENQMLKRAHFMGDPIMGIEIDTMYYNQVKGKDMNAYFANGEVYRNDVDGNAQTIYYMQEEDAPDVTGMMYIESSAISFYLVDGEMDKIAYKQNPEYVLYPVQMIPEDQELRLPDFDWYDELRPTRDSVHQRTIESSRRESRAVQRKPLFPITDRIDYDRRRLVENRVWIDRLDELTPEVVEWRNSRPSYQNKK
ncbi:MAG: hypothetical protein J6K40_05800 [Alistipes sp.]|nr:hypothetical protein [Alistipes sp.]